MADLYDTVIQTIKDKCPGINWKLGGLLRELLIEPISVIQSTVSQYLATAVKDLDLATALEEPATHEQTLDVWMNRLRLSAPPRSVSRGRLALIISDLSKDIVIPNRSAFTCSGVTLITTSEHRATTTTCELISPECYVYYIDVECQDGRAVNISEGVAIQWSSAPAAVQDIYVHSAITGGMAMDTAQAKANMIEAALADNSVVGDKAISAALVKRFPGMVVGSAFVNDEGAPANSLPLCVKLRKSCDTQVINLRSSLVNGEEYVVLPVLGVVDVVDVCDENNDRVDYAVVWDSATPKVVCVGGASERDLKVTYRAFSDLVTVANWLNTAQRALPYKFSCMAPAEVRVKMFINTGGVPLDLDVRTSIQEYLIDKPLDSTITDSEIASILERYRYKVTGAILYSATVKYQGYTDTWSSAGAISPAGQIGLHGAPTALYTTVADIVGC